MRKIFLIFISMFILLSCNLISKKKEYTIKVEKAMRSFNGDYDKIDTDELKAEYETDSMAYEYGVLAYYSRLIVAKQMEAETGILLYETVGFTVLDKDGNDIKKNLTEECIIKIEDRIKELNSKELNQ